MRKYIVSLLLFLSIPLVANAQTASLWKLSNLILQPVISTWQFELPQLGGGGNQCVQVNNNGLFSGTGTVCGGSAGSSTPGLPVNSVQFNNSGLFGGSASFTITGGGTIFNAIGSSTFAGGSDYQSVGGIVNLGALDFSSTVNGWLGVTSAGLTFSSTSPTVGFINASTTATSTYAGPIISPCFATSTAGPCITGQGGGSGIPAGLSTWIQFNSNNKFDATSTFAFASSSGVFTFPVGSGTSLSLTSPLPVTSGGLGGSTFPANQVLVGNVMSPITHSINTPADGNILRFYSIDNVPSWGSLDLANSNAIGVSVLGFANGGTNSSSTYTVGSVIFSNGTKLTQDNANLFWNDASNFLGIGTTTPDTTISAVGTTTTTGLKITSLSKTLLAVDALGNVIATTSTAGGGGVSSVTCGTGLSGGTITTTGTCSITAPIPTNLGGTGTTTNQNFLTISSANTANVFLNTGTNLQALTLNATGTTATSTLAGSTLTTNLTASTSLIIGSSTLYAAAQYVGVGTTTAKGFTNVSLVVDNGDAAFTRNIRLYDQLPGNQGSINWYDPNSIASGQNGGPSDVGMFWNSGHPGGGEFQVAINGQMSINTGEDGNYQHGKLQIGTTNGTNQASLENNGTIINTAGTFIGTSTPFGNSNILSMQTRGWVNGVAQVNSNILSCMYGQLISTSTQEQNIVFDTNCPVPDNGTSYNVRTSEIITRDGISTPSITTSSTTASSTIVNKTSQQDTLAVVPNSLFAVGLTGAQTVASATMNTIESGFGGTYTYRTVVANAQLKNQGGFQYFRVRVNSATNNSFLTINNATIGYASSTGNAYAYTATPTQITFNGSTTLSALLASNCSAGGHLTLCQNSPLFSDWIRLPYVAGKNLVVAIEGSTTPGFGNIEENSGQTGYQLYYINASDAFTVNATGYTTDGTVGSAIVDLVQSGNLDPGIGIGTTTPDARLTIAANTAASSSEQIFDIASSTNPILNILGNGRVGLGTTSPSSQLAMTGTTTAAGYISSNLLGVLLATDLNGNFVATTSTGSGTNYFSNSGATTTLITGSILQSNVVNATSSTATSTFAGNVSVKNITATGNSTILGTESVGNINNAIHTFTIGTSGSIGIMDVLTTNNAPGDFAGVVLADGAGTGAAGFLKSGIFFQNTDGSANRGQLQFAVDPNNDAGSVVNRINADTLMTLNYQGNVGIGTSTPAGRFAITSTSTNATNVPLFLIASSSISGSVTQNLFAVDGIGSQISGGGQGSLSCAATCTFAAHANDTSGTIILSGAQTSVTMTFSKPKQWAPNCVVSDNLTTGTYDASSTATNVVFSVTSSIGTATLTYFCPL